MQRSAAPRPAADAGEPLIDTVDKKSSAAARRPSLDVAASYRVALAGEPVPPARVRRADGVDHSRPRMQWDWRRWRDRRDGAACASGACLATCLLVVCFILIAVCVLLFVIAVTYGVLYAQVVQSAGHPAAAAALAVAEEGNFTNETETADDLQPGQTQVQAVRLGLIGDKMVTKFILRNVNGMEVDVVSHGARVNAVRIPSKAGMIDVLEGVDETNLTNFLGNQMGVANGPVCSAISWTFQYLGKRYSFAKPPNAPPAFYVDGGVDGFYTLNYQVSYVDARKRVHFVHSDRTPSGYPSPAGSYQVHTTYELTPDNELIVSMSLTADTTIPVDMCSSLPFNLGGEGTNTLTNHSVFIHSTDSTAVDGNGMAYNIQAAPYLQFLPAHSIQPVINYVTQLKPRYDFTYSSKAPTGKHLVCTVSHSVTGIQLDIYSDQPAVRFTVPDRGSLIKGKYNHTYTGPSAFVIQPHRYPLFDASSQPTSAISAFMLSSKDKYAQETSYKFTF